MVEGKEAIEQVTSPSDCEQSFFLVDEAKRHRYFLEKAFEIDFNDPFLALQRDSRFLQTSSNSLNRDVKHEIRSDIKEVCLGELIDAHKHVHAFFREQLLLAEERYAALCSTFEEERKRLERDAAQGDDVVAMLEKEREKLQIELENERTQNKRLEKELKRALDNYNNQKALTQRQRMVAAQIIKEKRRISKEFLAKCEQVEQLESKLGLKSAVLPDISSAGKAVYLTECISVVEGSFLDAFTRLKSWSECCDRGVASVLSSVSFLDAQVLAQQLGRQASTPKRGHRECVGCIQPLVTYTAYVGFIVCGAVSPSTTAKVPTCLRSPVEADASSSVEPSSRNQRSMSPPPKCRGSKNSPPPPPSPVIPPSKLDSGGCTVSP
ncbi:unnamed protein product [Mesocestoides corti]|uniref:Cortactin-binding protein-2 N-terminal domain-containing protein n=1 Tax=Mesocestoides corti TaxID=53468 RepID=A0A0R3U9I4_MESCO|nr:unnamed protein product [Mesocestoides corti]